MDDFEKLQAKFFPNIKKHFVDEKKPSPQELQVRTS